MTEFSARAMLEVEVDSRSLNDARDTIESELGSVRAMADTGGSSGASPTSAALTDGGDGVRGLLEQQTEHLEEIREGIEDISTDVGGSGGGSDALLAGGALRAAPTALPVALAAFAEAGLIGAAVSTEGDGPSPPTNTPPSEVQTTGVLQLVDAIRNFASSPPSWLNRLTNVSFGRPSWLSELTTLPIDDPPWLSTLENPQITPPSWLSELTSVTFDAPPWLSDLTDPQINAPPWLSELECLLDGGSGVPNNGRPESFPGSDQRLFNEATRRRDSGSGDTDVTNDITIEAVIDDLSTAQRTIERAVDNTLRDRFIDGNIPP